MGTDSAYLSTKSEDYGTTKGRDGIEFGGDGGARTPNLGIANAALSQLSYVPIRPSAKVLHARTESRRVFQPSNAHPSGQRVPRPIPTVSQRRVPDGMSL